MKLRPVKKKKHVACVMAQHKYILLWQYCKLFTLPHKILVDVRLDEATAVLWHVNYEPNSHVCLFNVILNAVPTQYFTIKNCFNLLFID